MGRSEETVYSGVPTEAGAGIPVATALSQPSPSPKIDDLSREQGAIAVQRGEAQSPEFRDKWFAIAFLVKVLLIIGSSIAFGPAVLEKIVTSSDGDVSGQEYGDEYENDYNDGDISVPPAAFWWTVAAASAFVAPVLSIVAMVVLSRNPISCIQCSLWSAVVLSATASIVLFALSPFAGIFYGVLTACLICYTRSVQSRM